MAIRAVRVGLHSRGTALAQTLGFPVRVALGVAMRSRDDAFAWRLGPFAWDCIRVGLQWPPTIGFPVRVALGVAMRSRDNAFAWRLGPFAWDCIGPRQ